MTKRRTKKQKQKAKHPFTVNWEPRSSTYKPEVQSASSTAFVKGQTKSTKKSTKLSGAKTNSTENTAVYENIASIKHNLVKSLVISSLILSLEVVLYFIWH